MWSYLIRKIIHSCLIGLNIVRLNHACRLTAYINKGNTIDMTFIVLYRTCTTNACSRGPNQFLCTWISRRFPVHILHFSFYELTRGHFLINVTLYIKLLLNIATEWKGGRLIIKHIFDLVCSAWCHVSMFGPSQNRYAVCAHKQRVNSNMLERKTITRHSSC